MINNCLIGVYGFFQFSFVSVQEEIVCDPNLLPVILSVNTTRYPVEEYQHGSIWVVYIIYGSRLVCAITKVKHLLEYDMTTD